MGYGKRHSSSLCQRLDDVKIMTPALNRLVVWKEDKAAICRQTARGQRLGAIRRKVFPLAPSLMPHA
jgi:hypothetical protein